MQKANLVVRPEKLGDLVVATPVFRAFKESFPDQPLHLLTDEIYADAVRHDPHIDKIISMRWKARTTPHRDSWRTIYQKLSPQSYQRAAILYYNCEGFNWLMAALRVPQVAQLGGTVASYLFFHRQVRRRGNIERIHFSKYYLRVAALLGAHAGDESPRLYLVQEEITAFRSRFPFLVEKKKRVIVHPFGHGSAPNCSLQAYARIMELLSKDPALEIFVTGTPAEREVWLKQFGSNPARTDWLGTVNVREWMVAASGADLMIGGATGVTHAAAALGRTTLALYCPGIGTTPVIWGPSGPRVHFLVVPEDQCRAVQPCQSACTHGVGCDLSFALKPEMVAQKAFALLAANEDAAEIAR